MIIQRKHPCLCIECPKCGSVFMATALNYFDAEDIEIIEQIKSYAKEGMNASFKNSDEFKLNLCEHMQNRKHA